MHHPHLNLARNIISTLYQLDVESFNMHLLQLMCRTYA